MLENVIVHLIRDNRNSWWFLRSMIHNCRSLRNISLCICGNFSGELDCTLDFLFLPIRFYGNFNRTYWLIFWNHKHTYINRFSKFQAGNFQNHFHAIMEVWIRNIICVNFNYLSQSNQVHIINAAVQWKKFPSQIMKILIIYVNLLWNKWTLHFIQNFD